MFNQFYCEKVKPFFLLSSRIKSIRNKLIILSHKLSDFFTFNILLQICILKTVNSHSKPAFASFIEVKKREKNVAKMEQAG